MDKLISLLRETVTARGLQFDEDDIVRFRISKKYNREIMITTTGVYSIDTSEDSCAVNTTRIYMQDDKCLIMSKSATSYATKPAELSIDNDSDLVRFIDGLVPLNLIKY